MSAVYMCEAVLRLHKRCTCCTSACTRHFTLQQHVAELKEVIQTLEIDLREARCELQVHNVQSKFSIGTQHPHYMCTLDVCKPETAESLESMP